MLKLTIPGRLPSLNEYVAKCRAHARAGGAMIKQDEQYITDQIRKNIRPLKYPVKLKYRFYEPSKRRDLDNISAYAHKCCQDCIVRTGGLPDDGWSYIKGYEDHFDVDKDAPRIEITILEDGEYDDDD